MPDQTLPPQHQDRQPGIERKMIPPRASRAEGRGTSRPIGWWEKWRSSPAATAARADLDEAFRPADEVAASYVFLASSDASYMTGQVLHPDGGEPVES